MPTDVEDRLSALARKHGLRLERISGIGTDEHPLCRLLDDETGMPVAGQVNGLTLGRVESLLGETQFLDLVVELRKQGSVEKQIAAESAKQRGNIGTLGQDLVAAQERIAALLEGLRQRNINLD